MLRKSCTLRKKYNVAQMLGICRVSHKIGSDKKLLFGAAHGFNLQFLNLFGFSISVRFLWCIIQRIWPHPGKVIAVFRRCMCLFDVQIQWKNSY